MSRRRGFTLIELLTVLGTIGILIALIMPAIQQSRESARSLSCINNMKAIGLAVQSYAARTNWFPPSDIHELQIFRNPRNCPPCALIKYSMLTRVLPDMDHSNLFDGINFSVASVDPRIPSSFALGRDANITCMTTRIATFICPSESVRLTSRTAPTSYRANQGSWPSFLDEKFYPLAGPCGLSGANNLSSSIASVTDGLAQTVLLSEKSIGTEKSTEYLPQRHFAMFERPVFGNPSNDDILAHCASPQARFGDPYRESGLVWMIGDLMNASYNHVNIPNPPLGDCIDADLGGFFVSTSSARSEHRGGVNVGMADGSVRFIRNSMTLNTWRSIGTKAGNESIPEDEF